MLRVKVKKVGSFICPPKQGCLARLRCDGGDSQGRERARGGEREGGKMDTLKERDGEVWRSSGWRRGRDRNCRLNQWSRERETGGCVEKER